MVLWLQHFDLVNHMNILALDYGTKRIGLAWMQTGLNVVLPYGLIEEGDRERNLDALLKLIEEERIDKLVIGLPFGEDGEENPNTERIRNFADQITARIDIKIAFIGEEFTTKEAEAMGGEVSLDEKSAMLILEAYIAQNG